MNPHSHPKSRATKDVAPALVPISLPVLCLAVVPLALLALVSWRFLHLPALAQGLVEGSLRTLGQLTWLATLLGPIFQSERLVYVVGYCLFMLFLAAYEASARTKYDFGGQFAVVWVSLALVVGSVAILTFGVLLRRGLSPCPWNPRYVIPVVGMLLGNSIGAVSLSLNAISRGLVEQANEIELYLSMGATPHEAVQRLWVEGIMNGATPVLQMMRVTGIISIPGMMTGQLLGGGDVATAARYQMLIIYLIGACTIGVILCNASIVSVWVAFDDHILRTDRFVLSRRKSVLATIVWGFGLCYQVPLEYFTSSHVTNTPRAEFKPEPVPAVEATSPNDSVSSRLLEIRALHQSCGSQETCVENGGNIDANDILLRVNNLTKYWGTQLLFSNLDLEVRLGDLFLVSGPSGVGKSTLFKGMAGLVPVNTGLLQLQDLEDNNDKYWDWHKDLPTWRYEVRYVPQSKLDIPGTPVDFMEKLSSFRSWRKSLDATKFSKDVSSYLLKWGLASDVLGKEWSQLSGGEYQRVIIAISLASNPRIVLFDESTSALDKSAKIAVEESVKSFVRQGRGAVLWISHDEEQAKRMILEA